jgi:LPXTG-site transpeptidase (sortase) family protein
MKLFTHKVTILVGTLLLILGLAGSMPAIYYHFSNNGSVSNHGLPIAAAESNIDNSAALISGQPVSISVPSLNINLPVINGYYDQKTKNWTLTSNKAQFAAATAQPNNLSGNTFIYGHALNNVFGHLNKIQPGAMVTITTANGYQFTYKFVSTYATQPTDMSVLSYHGSPILTVQTCSGTWYQNRQMYLFSYQGYSKI